MNCLNAIGRVAQDPELRQTPDGTPVLGLRLAVDAGYGQNKSTLWMDGSLFGKRAEALAPYISKGDQIGINGELSMDNWIDREGRERQTLRLRISEVTLISNKSEQQTAADNTANSAPSQPDSGGGSFEDDIPFDIHQRGQFV